MDRSEALIRDVAKLFIKYDRKDWHLIINALRGGGPEYEKIAHAIDQLSTKKRVARTVSEQSRVDRLLDDVRQSNPERSEVLAGLHKKISEKRNTLTVAYLKDFLLKTGFKEALPKQKSDAILYILKYLSELRDDELEPTLRSVLAKDRDLQEEYNDWFKMISRLERR